MSVLSFLDLISIARKYSQFVSFAVWASSQFAHFDDICEHDSVDLHITHICILMSWFWAQNRHFACVSLHVLIRCSNFWHLWHWLIRLFKNSVTCSTLSFTINSFLIVLSASSFDLKLILIEKCVLFSRFSTRVNHIDSRANVTSLYVSISFWNSFIELSNVSISTSCTIRSNQISSSWTDFIENSLSQIDRHWINWFAVFFFETVNTILFSVLDKLIIVIKISTFASFNFLFILSLHSDELISLTKFFENMIILRLFHWIVSFSFAVWALFFWFAIFVVFLLTTFAHVEDDNEDVEFEFVWSFVRDFSKAEAEAKLFLAVCVFFDVWDISFASDCVLALIKIDFLDVSRFNRDCDWIIFFSTYSIISFVIFSSNVFFNCWKFSNIVSQYDDILFDFFIKSIDAKSKFFFVCIWSMKTDVSLFKSRFALARSIWLISCCIITCSIFAILRPSNKIFCAFFNVSSTDSTSLEILIESNFFLRAIWRCFFALLFRLISASNLWLEIDKSIVSVSFSKIVSFSTLSFSFSFSFEQTLFMLCLICWLTWLWFNWFAFNWSEFDWFEID